MMILSLTVTTVTAVTKKRDIPPLRVAQSCGSSRAIYLCNSAREYCPKTGYNGYTGYRQPVARVWGHFARNRKRRERAEEMALVLLERQNNDPGEGVDS